jgi:hypothetical protein
MKKLLGVGAALLLALSLAGCGAPTRGTEAQPRPTDGINNYNEWVRMDDGRLVYCYNDGHGVSCDWEGAK